MDKEQYETVMAELELIEAHVVDLKEAVKNVIGALMDVIKVLDRVTEVKQ